ncbi:MAG: cobalamin-binding protein [Gammaproteobacteria bacterium]
MKDYGPRRIVCLTEETTETLYLLGQQHRIVGISGYTVRPPQARREKPKVSAFTSANLDMILELQPDLVLGFSDLQADMAADLIRRGIAVHVFNQRGIDGILSMMVTLGSMVGEREKALEWVAGFEARRARLESEKRQAIQSPRIYFEEWDEPIISGIRWVSELIELAGGTDCFADLASQSLAKDRIVADPMAVVRRQPDIIIGSWCGKRFRPEKVAAREGWDQLPAVLNQQLHEIKSPLILQPGPAALTDGLDALLSIVAQWRATQP